MPTILVVDDRRDAQLAVSAKLEAMGFAVRTSDSAVDIVEQVLDAMADVVFMDMNMPEIDGFEAAQILRTDERTSFIPIVMLSVTTSPEERELAMQAGCVELISKPLEEEVIKELLSRVIASPETAVTRESTG